MSEPEEEDFAAMFEASFKARRFERGQAIEGTIVSIGPEVALVNVGGKGEAVVDVAELTDANGVLEVAVGDRLLATVVSTDGGLTLSRKRVRGEAAKQLKERQREEVRRSAVVGAVLTGRVTSVLEFGAFVDLGAGVHGLLHVSEMSWSRVNDPSKVVTPGQEITVQVLRVDDNTQKIALGLKQLTADPWSTIHAHYAVGQVVNGRVTRLAQFGAFIELEPGVEALAHASTFKAKGRADEWSKSVALNTSHTFEILSIDSEKKRIGVALALDAEEARDTREYTERQEVAPPEAFGSLADKLRGALEPKDE